MIFKIKSFGISGDLLELIENFRSNRFQRVVLNGQITEWEKINAGMPPGSILGSLFFLIYINDLTDGTSSIAKLFADDTSLFSVVQNKNNSASQLNNDLNKVSDCAHTWKISFTLDPSKQAQEVILSRICTKKNHPPIYFHDIPVTQTTVQKHIGMYLDEKLNYNTYIKENSARFIKGLGYLETSPINFQDKLLLQFIRCL